MIFLLTIPSLLNFESPVHTHLGKTDYLFEYLLHFVLVHPFIYICGLLVTVFILLIIMKVHLCLNRFRFGYLQI